MLSRLFERLPPIARAVREALASGKAYDAVMRVPWEDGSTRWVAAKGRPFFDNRGRAVRLAGMVLDSPGDSA